MLGIELAGDGAGHPHLPALAAHVKRECKRRFRVLLSTEGPYANVIKIKVGGRGGWVGRRGCVGGLEGNAGALCIAGGGPGRASACSASAPRTRCPRPRCAAPHLLHRGSGGSHGGCHGRRVGRAEPGAEAAARRAERARGGRPAPAVPLAPVTRPGPVTHRPATQRLFLLLHLLLPRISTHLSTLTAFYVYNTLAAPFVFPAGQRPAPPPNRPPTRCPLAALPPSLHRPPAFCNMPLGIKRWKSGAWVGQ